MILLDNRDLSLSVFIFFSFPSPFGYGKNLTFIRYRALPRGLMLAGKLQTLPGRDDSQIVKSRMAI